MATDCVGMRLRKGSLVKPTEDYVRNKIRTSTPKNRGVESRARASGRRIIKRAEKKLASVLKQFPQGAVKKAIDVLEGQLKATKQIWDVNAKVMVDIPDEKIRQDAALAILAYEWGTPVQRSISAHADFEDLGSLLEAMRQSPASQDSLQKTVEKGKEVRPELPYSAREEGGHVG
jgi:hypothetical protein